MHRCWVGHIDMITGGWVLFPYKILCVRCHLALLLTKERRIHQSRISSLTSIRIHSNWSFYLFPFIQQTLSFSQPAGSPSRPLLFEDLYVVHPSYVQDGVMTSSRNCSYPSLLEHSFRWMTNHPPTSLTQSFPHLFIDSLTHQPPHRYQPNQSPTSLTQSFLHLFIDSLTHQPPYSFTHT